MKRTLRVVLSVSVGLALLCTGPRLAEAAAFTIPDGDVAALKNAINTANTNGQDDTIELAANGTYTLTTVDNGDNGLPPIVLDNDKKLVIHGNGSTIQRSDEHGVPPFRIFFVDYGGELSLWDMTIRNGALATDIESFGGGISSDYGKVTLDNCALTNNQAKHGGGVYSTFGSVTVTNSTFTGNVGGASGGGIECFATSHLTFIACNFANNSAGSGGAIVNAFSNPALISNCTFTGNNGGAISNRAGGTLSVTDSTFEGNNGSAIGNTVTYNGYTEDANLAVIRCRFTNNSAGSGGAIYNYTQRFAPTDPSGFAILSVADSEFEGNSAEKGGAIYSVSCCGIWRGVSRLTVTTSTFHDNSARDGGAIYVTPSASSSFANNVSNSTFAGNTTYVDENTNPDLDGGGAVYCRAFDSQNAPLTLNNCTLSGNSAPYHGGGIFLLGTNGSPTVRLNSCILKTGTSGENLYNSSGTIASQGYNLSNDNGGGYLTGSGDQTNTDPMLDPAGLHDNGGPTQTIALLPGSPAINTGNPNAPARDQRYYLRNGAPDKGAFEYGGTISPLTVVSRKNHGPSGMFDVDLPLDGNTGVECRSGGASGNHQLILTFATPVTISGASVTTGTGSVSNTTVNGSEVTLDLTGVTNAQQIVLTVSGVNDGANSNYVIIPMRVLLGDTTGNSAVNASDVSQTKSQVGQAVTSSNFRADINLSGTISASDVAVVKSKVGTVIPIPAAPADANSNIGFKTGR